MTSDYDYSLATDILSIVSDGSNSDDDEVRFWFSWGRMIRLGSLIPDGSIWDSLGR